MLAIVLAVACVGKLVGCSLGAFWGGLRFWEAASIAVAMNARGAMEIVVATIGLSLGILTPQMFSIIVMVAIVTSFLAPLGLRLTMPRVRMTDDEARRILASQIDGRVRSRRACACCWRPAAASNALAAAPLAFGLARKSDAPGQDRARRGASGPGGGELLRAPALRRAASPSRSSSCARWPTGAPPEIAHVSGASVARAICDEAKRGCDVIVLGLGRRAVDRRAGGRAGGRRGAVPRRDHEGAGARRANTGASWSRSTAASRRGWRSSSRCATPRRRAPSWRWRC